MVKKIVFVVSQKNFRDEELFDTQEELIKAGIETVIASDFVGNALGKLGGIAKATKAISEINSMEFDGIVFVGGIGAEKYLNDLKIHDLAKKFFVEKKVVAAICIAPSILANAGLLDGKNATAFSDQLENLQKKGAKVLAKNVVVDGRIVTANGPVAAKEFGKQIAKLLQ